MKSKQTQKIGETSPLPTQSEEESSSYNNPEESSTGSDPNDDNDNSSNDNDKRNNNKNKNDASAVASTKSSNSKQGSNKSRLRRELDSLHEEMQVAQYGINYTGQLRRKFSKHQSKLRTRKRRLLEAQDDEMFAEEKDRKRRLRGPKASLGDEVVQGSLAFGFHRDADGQNEDLDDDDDSVDDSDDRMLEDDVASVGEEATDNDEEEDYGDGESEMENEELGGSEGEEPDEDEEGGASDDDKEDDSGDDQVKKKRSRMVRSKRAKSGKKQMKKGRMYRLRNFKSLKMAQRHGDAMAAHTRGMPKLAIQKLKQIAKQAPSAPQVYSSLGMVYEDMLRDCQRKAEMALGDSSREEELYASNPSPSDIVPNHLLAEQLDLAKKAYGSYHVAAILCKKDYALWARGADCAAEIAQLHATAMLLPNISHVARENHRSEKTRWLSEAKNGYQTADNLKPPGIEVSIKLASFLIELGHLSEALTLLTDLKNSSTGYGESPSTFQSSYRAWMLYADLMLRIGYECDEWNAGNQSNSNYMFRRWLRKLASSFDWQERRFQALARALEAAAGSKSCKLLVEWMESRARATKSLGSVNDGSGAGALDGKIHTGEEFEREKELLLERNRIEIAAFDKTSSEMDLSSSIAMEARETARESLITKQKSAVLELVGSFHSRSDSTVPPTAAPVQELQPETMIKSSFPISGSCRAVCRIASELFRHMLSMGLFVGGRLVGDAASKYFKERASVLDKRVESQRNIHDSQMMPTNVFALHHEAYDTVTKSDDEDESDCPLSDDDELGQYQSSGIVSSLRSGALPPELTVLYGLSVAGEGGKEFLALQYIAAIDSLEQEPLKWLSEGLIDTSDAVDSSWHNLEKTMTEPLGRTAAYALISELLQRGELKIQGDKLSALFSSHVELLVKNGFIEEVLKSAASHSLALQRQSQVLDIFLTSARCQALHVERLAQNPENQEEEATMTAVIRFLDCLSRYLALLWRVEEDGSISSTCIEILSIMATSLYLLPSLFRGTSSKSCLERLVEKMLKTVSLLCTTSNLNLSGGNQNSIKDLKTIPLPDSWLTDELKMLSQRAFNCVIGTNCSHFSGWEKDEFSKDLLKWADTPYFFGITITGGQIGGYVNPSHASSLFKQWEVLRVILPESFSFDFTAHLSALSSTAAFKEMQEKHHTALAQQRISLYGEAHCLSILLSFSNSCLQLALKTDDEKRKERLVRIALSIVLPISQVCLKQTLWTSDIGRAAFSPGLKEWRPVRVDRRTREAPERSLFSRSKKRTPSSAAANGDQDLHHWFGGEDDESPLSNIIPIPLSALLAEWKACGSDLEGNEIAGSHETMKKLDTSMRNLRLCYSEAATEKASLAVAACLLELIESPACENPFVCLQQATRFASQGTKGGISDELFKMPLPKTPSPFQALAILGRSDCLQALYFYPEAAFLCSYVANICRLHRSPDQPQLEWNSRWMMVTLLAYNQSVFLRAAANNVVKEHGRKEDTAATWEAPVIEELKRAKSEGLRWLATIGYVHTEAGEKIAATDATDLYLGGSEGTGDFGGSTNGFSEHFQETSFVVPVGKYVDEETQEVVAI